MRQKYEYRIVRIGTGTKDEEHRQVVHDHAREGRRLVRVPAPGAGGVGATRNLVEAIIERDLTE